VARYVLTLRREGATGKQRFDSLEEALDRLELEARAFAATERREARRALTRTYEAVQLVALRASLSGSRIAAGVDVRGDGSAEAWTGRFRRSVLAQRDGESPYDALRRVLGYQPSGPSSAP
jgi:hypothetical protein